MTFGKKSWWQIGLMLMVLIFVFYRSMQVVPLSNHPGTGYDEQMWTSASIASYNMFFNGVERTPQQLDNWFATYAWRNGVDVFTGEQYEQFATDTIKFPYDYITPVKGGYSSAIKFDTIKFPRSEHQWFDKDLWTFGWKAPNLGKYIMGWWIEQFSETKPDPQGYFVYYQPVHELDTSRKDFTPSTKPSAAPFSYAPQEYVAIARIPNMLAYIFCIAVVMLIGWLCISYAAGLIAGLWLAFNTVFLNVNTAVGLDALSTLFSVLAVLFLIKTVHAILNQKSWYGLLGWAAATGLAIAFAMSSKLNAGVLVYVVMIVYGLVLITAWMRSRNKKANPKTAFSVYFKRGIVSGVIIGTLSAGLFLGLNPQLTPQPHKRIKAMRESIDEYFTRRATIFTQNERKRDIKTATNWVKVKDEFGLSFELMLERIGYVNNPQKNYYGTLGALLKFKGNIMDGLLAVIGLYTLLMLSWNAWKNKKEVSGAGIVLIAFVIIFIGNTSFLWQDWSRYFTPVFPLYSILVGLGLVTLVNWGGDQFKKSKKASK